MEPKKKRKSSVRYAPEVRERNHLERKAPECLTARWSNGDLPQLTDW